MESHIMSIVKVQYVIPVHLRIVRCHHRVEESPFLKAEKPTMGSLQLMRRGVLCRPSNYVDCGMLRRNEPRTGRRCREGQTADSGLLESAEASPNRHSGPSRFLAQTVACLTQRLGQTLTSQ